MARPKESDSTEATDRALRVFWSQGFAATSLDDLTAAMEISRSSLYATFGSKHELFLATLAHHNETILPRYLASLDATETGVKQAITEIFSQITLGDGQSSGWFLAKIASEVAPDDEPATQFIATGMEAVEDAFLGAITAAQETGELPPWRDARALARHFTAALSGFAVVARTRPGRESLEDISAVALSVLD